MSAKTKRTARRPFTSDDDLRSVCFHEAAHYVVACHFGLFASVEIFKTGRAGIYNRAFAGKCSIFGSASHFQLAATAFGGPLIDEALTEVNPIAVLGDKDWLRQECYWIQDYPDGYSATDLAMINRHFQPWRACKTAGAVLVRRFSELEEKANNLISVHKMAMAQRKVKL